MPNELPVGMPILWRYSERESRRGGGQSERGSTLTIGSCHSHCLIMRFRRAVFRNTPIKVRSPFPSEFHPPIRLGGSVRERVANDY